MRKPAADNPEAIEALCGHLASGLSMTEACALDECPAERSVYRRMATDVEFGRIIAGAREAQQHAEIDATVALADAATPEDWQVVKLRIWARQWRAGKLAPKVYGDKIDLNHSGEMTFRSMSDEQLAERIAAIDAAALALSQK